jgi:hypothetical protein
LLDSAKSLLVFYWKTYQIEISVDFFNHLSHPFLISKEAVVHSKVKELLIEAPGGAKLSMDAARRVEGVRREAENMNDS